MADFKNCLRKGDVVLNVRTKKRGVVFRSPQEWDRNVAVLTDGKKRHRTADVLDLRFVPPGDEPEDVPPIEGDLLPVGMKKPEPKVGTCAGCKFYKAPVGDNQPFPTPGGECRRHAPTSAARWASVSSDDWCGEFKGR